jgi:hypothetical protein
VRNGYAIWMLISTNDEVIGVFQFLSIRRNGERMIRSTSQEGRTRVEFQQRRTQNHSLISGFLKDTVPENTRLYFRAYTAHIQECRVPIPVVFLGTRDAT